MRTLVKRNRLYPEVPSLFNEFFRGDWFDHADFNYALNDSTLPSVNIREDNDKYELEVAVPGMEKDDFKVELNNNMLIVSSEREVKKEEKENNYTRREFSYQTFTRSFRLPENKVEGGKISASYKDGILNISVPKREEAKVKPVRMIKIA